MSGVVLSAVNFLGSALSAMALSLTGNPVWLLSWGISSAAFIFSIAVAD